MSREVLLTHVHGRRAGRHTQDIDIAVFVKNWQQFTQSKDRLLQSGATEVPKNMHRFLWEGVELDIIPFGDIAEENKLLWSPDREIIMSVDGFTEAYTHATMVAISSHCQVKFVHYLVFYCLNYLLGEIEEMDHLKMLLLDK